MAPSHVRCTYPAQSAGRTANTDSRLRLFAQTAQQDGLRGHHCPLGLVIVVGEIGCCGLDIIQTLGFLAFGSKVDPEVVFGKTNSWSSSTRLERLTPAPFEGFVLGEVDGEVAALVGQVNKWLPAQDGNQCSRSYRIAAG